MALSDDGDTLAVGANGEDSNAVGIGGDQADNSAGNTGAVYVFARGDNANWSQQAYVKSTDSDPSDYFGSSVAWVQRGAVERRRLPGRECPV